MPASPEEVVANKLQLFRQVHKGAFVLLEGQDDRLFYYPFLDSEQCRLEVVGDKELVCDVLGILEDRQIPGIVGIVDADFDALSGRSYRSGNIVANDCHDIETLLVRASSLDRVLRELGSDEKRRAFEGHNGHIRDVLIKAALPVGCLRFHSINKGLNLKFKGLQFARFLDQKTLEVDIDKLIKAVKDNSHRFELNSHELREAIESVEEDLANNPWHACNGHDLVNILSIALRRAIGTQTAARVQPEVLGSELRLALQSDDFEATALCRELRLWQSRSSPFRILRT